jgi:hypothetical protein
VKLTVPQLAKKFPSLFFFFFFLYCS